MSNYSDNPNSCRVDFFKESGKWYATEAVVFPDEYYEDMATMALEKVLILHFKGTPRFTGMNAVYLEPYVRFACPVMITVE